MKQFSITTTINQAAPIFGAAALSGLVMFVMQAPAQAFNILAGSDLLHTPLGSGYDFGGPIGQVSWKSVPVGPGNTDTIVERLEDAIFDDNGDSILERTSDTIDIELSTLSLQSDGPVNFDGSLFGVSGSQFDVFLGLTPGQRSTGTMTINHNFTTDLQGNNLFDDSGEYQGTFTSLFDVWFDATFVSRSSGEQFVISGTETLLNEGANWTHGPEKNTFITGPAEHTKPDGTPFDGHDTVPYDVPEPLTTLASVTGLAFGGILKRKNDKKNKKQQKA